MLQHSKNIDPPPPPGSAPPIKFKQKRPYSFQSSAVLLISSFYLHLNRDAKVNKFKGSVETTTIFIYF